VPGQNGESPIDSSAAGDGSPDTPNLTVGQRLLLKLPDLGRNKSAGSTKSLSGASKAPAKQEIDHVDDVEVIDDGDAETPEPDSSSAPRSTSRTSRSATARPARSASPSPYDDMPTSELSVLMRKLDEKERKLAFGAAPLGAVLAIVVTIFAVHSNPALHHKGHESVGIIIADGGVGVVFALFVFVMAWIRRRSLTAFALLFLGYSVGLIGPGIPFLFLGGYLLYRAWKIQKVLTSRGVNTRPQSRRTTTSRPSRDPKPRRDAQVKTAGARPTASKRYTPPKPPPKRPPIAKPEKAAGS
jgi:hypothetical protein